MIFVAAGTQDGRELVSFLLEQGYDVAASVVSRYGEQLLEKECQQQLIINDQPLNEQEMECYIADHGIRLLVDASHPYAENVSANAMKACRTMGIPYVRYERQETAFSYDKLFIVEGYEAAAVQAAALGRRIFLTTGSRNLRHFAESQALRECELVARVLPSPEVVAECTALGFTPGQIIAMQGPFSKELNKELYLKYRAEVIVTKNSGRVGGTDTKLEAAAELSLPVVVIDRPKMAYDHLAKTFGEVLTFIREKHG